MAEKFLGVEGTQLLVDILKDIAPRTPAIIDLAGSIHPINDIESDVMTIREAMYGDDAPRSGQLSTKFFEYVWNTCGLGDALGRVPIYLSIMLVWAPAVWQCVSMYDDGGHDNARKVNLEFGNENFRLAFSIYPENPQRILFSVYQPSPNNDFEEITADEVRAMLE